MRNFPPTVTYFLSLNIIGLMGVFGGNNLMAVVGPVAAILVLAIGSSAAWIVKEIRSGR